MNDDTLTWHARARVQKWTPDQVAWVRARTGIMEPSGDLLAEYITPEIVEADGNLLTTAGLTRIMSLLTGGGGQAAVNTATRLGVGNGTTPATVADTDLSAAAGAGNRWFQVMDATYPSIAAGVVTFKSTYDGSTANFVWAEWGTDIGPPTVVAGSTVNACLLNHKTGANLGTKTSGTWSLQTTITLT